MSHFDKTRRSRNRRGASALEYVLMILLIGVLVTGGLAYLGEEINNGLGTAAETVSGAQSQAIGGQR